MSTAEQLWALGQKDLYIAKRSKCRCCCEMTIPLFILPFIVLLLVFTRGLSGNKYFDTNLNSIKLDTEALQFYNFTFPNDAAYQKFNESAQQLNVTLPGKNGYKSIQFVEFDLEKPKFRYIFKNYYFSGLSKVGWSNPYDDEDDFYYYGEDSDRLTEQYTIDAILLNINKIQLASIKEQELPSPAYRFSIVNLMLPNLAILVVAASLIPIANVGKDVIFEVESEIKTYLLVLGMTRLSFYFSHFINGLLKVTLILLIIILPFMFTLKIGVSFALFGLVFLFSITMIAYAMFWATILHRPGVCMTVIILSTIFLTVLANVWSNDRLNVALMCACSLNPVSALKMAFQDLKFYDRYGLAPWPGQRVGYQFNSFLAAIFLIIDTILLISITLILDVILPSAGQTGLSFSTIIKRFKKGKVYVEDVEQDFEKEDFEAERRNDVEPDIKVVNLKKKWNGNFAVSGVNFNAYPGEITCLLGHNGAGKTTTFSCLTGYIKPTSGNLSICGINVRENLTEARKKIGYCPQKNPIFDRLTCIEHLRLAAKLRGSYCGETDIHETLAAVGLGHAMEMLAGQLSGGMKRKLCVALALVGRSQVVLLDEPTAGMDPIARKSIGDILDRFKKDRTILYTTHYMDEADLLADKIVILVKGVVAACGSSSFLKQRFGTGFLLSITMNVDGQSVEVKAQRILDEIQVEIPEARFEGSPAIQFSVNLPYESKTKFSELFTNLEDKSVKFGIDSFGLSVNTLEQVFIKVGDKAEGVSSRELRDKIIANAEIIRKEDDQRTPNCFSQLIALCLRNFTYWIRHPIRTLVPFVVVLICLGALLFMIEDSKSSGSKSDKDVLWHSLSKIPKSEILVDGFYSSSVKKLIAPLSQCNLVSTTDFNTSKHSFDTPPPSLAVFRKNSTVYLMFNRFLRDGALMAINLFSNLMFGKSYDTITVGYKSERGLDFDTSDYTAPALHAVVAIVGLTFGLAMLLSEVISERFTKFKNQLFLAGVNRMKYWGAQYTTDFLYFFTLAIFVFGGGVLAAKIHFVCATGLLPILFIYFFTASTASYFLSFAFDSSTKGVVFILAFHTIIPMISYVLLFLVVMLIGLLIQLKYNIDASTVLLIKDYIDIIFGILFPAMPLFQSQAQLYDICKSKNSTFSDIYKTKNTLGNDEANRSLLSATGLQAMISLPIGLILYGLLLILVEMKVFRRIRNKDIVKTDLPWPKPDDEDVMLERKRVSELSDSDLSLACRSLYKYYNANKCALENLTFGINPNECFGLLGINGAGKTTTFEILSGSSKPSSGTATIGGTDVQLNPVIGYAPQFDALSEFLTANDTLRLIGRLNGFENVEERVKLVLQCVMMEDHADKIVKECSGGQKRRVSIAVSLMSGAKFLMLDEPSAGVDPGTRRQIWDLLSAMLKQNKSILLTTHSMEECEALCGRIGFLRDGKLQAIGTSQHLKSRYGNSYILTLIQTIPNEESASRIDIDVQNEFKAEPTQESYQMTSLSWVIPRRSNISFGQIYSNVENYVEGLNRRYAGAIKDFYLIQNSLDQVFSRLAAIENAEIDNLASPVNTANQFNQVNQFNQGNPVNPVIYNQQMPNQQRNSIQHVQFTDAIPANRREPEPWTIQNNNLPAAYSKL